LLNRKELQNSELGSTIAAAFVDDLVVFFANLNYAAFAFDFLPEKVKSPA
jgi:hypothetical protein